MVGGEGGGERARHLNHSLIHAVNPSGSQPQPPPNRMFEDVACSFFPPIAEIERKINICTPSVILRHRLVNDTSIALSLSLPSLEARGGGGTGGCKGIIYT